MPVVFMTSLSCVELLQFTVTDATVPWCRRILHLAPSHGVCAARKFCKVKLVAFVQRASARYMLLYEIVKLQIASLRE